MGGRVQLAGALLAGGTVLICGCSGSGKAAESANSSAAPSQSSSAPTQSPTPTPTPHRTLKPGARGPDVEALQKRLKDLNYDPGKPDGKYGPGTEMAVWAFEKVNKLKVTSKLGRKFWTALDAPKTPTPLTKKREADRVDVDLNRQFLVVYKAGQPVLISHISSGSGEYYCAKDFGAKVPRCRYASTQLGDFETGRRVSGWDTSPLGHLYNPVYFNGGIAFHGYPDVPTYPASHGCVRIPMTTADLLPELVGTGVPVHVRNKA